RSGRAAGGRRRGARGRGPSPPLPGGRDAERGAGRPGLLRPLRLCARARRRLRKRLSGRGAAGACLGRRPIHGPARLRGGVPGALAMPRYRLDIEYDGRAYAGWQRQAELATVQEAIEKAILGFTGETVTIRGAGRTDAGVHAMGQVVHVDLGKDWDADKVQGALNAHLTMAGEAVSVLSAARVGDD